MSSLQISLLDAGSPTLQALAPEHRELADGAWIEHQPGWLEGSDECFARVHEWAPWDTYAMPMYGRMVRSPRLTTFGPIAELPDQLRVLKDAADELSRRHGVRYTRVGCNLYRDGRDSVAWHGDKESGMVAIISVGERRTFRLRPRGGGASLSWRLGRGDLLVMGGTCQRTWEHTVAKVTMSGPRISITLRTDAPAILHPDLENDR